MDTPRRSETAVCVLRVERQSSGVLITVTITRDITTGQTDPPIRYSAASNAADGIAAFLEDFEKRVS